MGLTVPCKDVHLLALYQDILDPRCSDYTEDLEIISTLIGKCLGLTLSRDKKKLKKKNKKKHEHWVGIMEKNTKAGERYGVIFKKAP